MQQSQEYYDTVYQPSYTLATNHIYKHENLIVDGLHKPVNTTHMVKKHHRWQISPTFRPAAHTIYSIAVGVYQNGYPATYMNSRDTIHPTVGTAVAIGPHHLLSCAHLFEFDTITRPFDHENCNIEIRARHDIKHSVNREKMYFTPQDTDLSLKVLSYADGHEINHIRPSNKFNPTPVGVDLVLLYSPTLLSVQSFPRPMKYHVSPNNDPTTWTSEEVVLLAYHGLPNMTQLYDLYPNTPKKRIDKAVKSMDMEYLSISEGNTVEYRLNAVTYHISSLEGSSGGGVYNAKGNLIGIHTRRQTTSDENILESGFTCFNIGVTLDAVPTWFAETVAPVLPPNLQADWKLLGTN